MTSLRSSSLFTAVCGLAFFSGCGSSENSTEMPDLSSATVIALNELTMTPGSYEWFDFKPNVKKLILAGAPETQHVAILWYTVTDGGVGLHYHSKTESVYAIEGTQTDEKGIYPTGTVYFNPPGSGHQITNSSGFFILAYAAPPDFANTALIGAYTPVRIDTRAPDLMTQSLFEIRKAGVRTFVVPVDSMGGLTSELMAVTASGDYSYVGNYLLVLAGSCEIEGMPFAEKTLVVGKVVAPRPYRLRAPQGSSCLAMGVSF